MTMLRALGQPPSHLRPRREACSRRHACLVATQASVPGSCVDGREPRGAAATLSEQAAHGGAAMVDAFPESTDPTAHATALCRVLGLPAPRFMGLLGRCPDLFAFSPEALDATLLAMSALTGLQTYQLPQLVSADPTLLLQPDRLKANMRGLAQVLAVPASEVASMAAREPSVLALGGEAAERRLQRLGEMMLLIGRPQMALRRSQLVEAMLTSPAVLLLPEPEEVEAQLQALEAALAPLVDLSDSAAAAVLAAAANRDDLQAELAPPPPAAAAGVVAVAAHAPSGAVAGVPAAIAGEVTVLSDGAAAAAAAPGGGGGGSGGGGGGGEPSLRHLTSPLVLSKPSLLTTPPELLAGRVAHLAAKSGMSALQVMFAAPLGPNLLAATSCHIDRHCAAMVTSLGTALQFTAPSPPPAAPTPSGSGSSGLAPSVGGDLSGGDAATSSSSSGSSERGGSSSSDGGGDDSSAPSTSARSAGGSGSSSSSSSVGAAGSRSRSGSRRRTPSDPESAAAAMLLCEPKLLGQHVSSLAAKWHLITSVCGGSPAWTARLERATVSERAELLALPYTTIARLRFLADCGRQAEADLLEAVRHSDALFHVEQPGFREWLRG